MNDYFPSHPSDSRYLPPNPISLKVVLRALELIAEHEQPCLSTIEATLKREHPKLEGETIQIIIGCLIEEKHSGNTFDTECRITDSVEKLYYCIRFCRYYSNYSTSEIYRLLVRAGASGFTLNDVEECRRWFFIRDRGAHTTVRIVQAYSDPRPLPPRVPGCNTSRPPRPPASAPSGHVAARAAAGRAGPSRKRARTPDSSETHDQYGNFEGSPLNRAHLVSQKPRLGNVPPGTSTPRTSGGWPGPPPGATESRAGSPFAPTEAFRNAQTPGFEDSRTATLDARHLFLARNHHS